MPKLLGAIIKLEEEVKKIEKAHKTMVKLLIGASSNYEYFKKEGQTQYFQLLDQYFEGLKVPEKKEETLKYYKNEVVSKAIEKVPSEQRQLVQQKADELLVQYLSR